MSNPAAAVPFASQPALRAPMLWGIVVGTLQAATPLAFWWLDSATVYALGLVVIAGVYVGFAVADGRPKVIAVESSVTLAFVVVAAAAVTGSPWLLVIGMVGHGLKDLWQHRSHFVAEHAMVAAVLHGCRLGRRRDHRREIAEACTSADRNGPARDGYRSWCTTGPEPEHPRRALDRRNNSNHGEAGREFKRSGDASRSCPAEFPPRGRVRGEANASTRAWFRASRR